MYTYRDHKSTQAYIGNVGCSELGRNMKCSGEESREQTNLNQLHGLCETADRSIGGIGGEMMIRS